jgi:hypothetical protein
MPEWTAVAWCAGCKHYIGPEAAGRGCPATDCDRTLRRRVGYICGRCEERPIMFSRFVYMRHMERGKHV